MPAKAHQRNGSTRTPRRRRGPAHNVALGTSIVRLAAGALSLGGDELVRRLNALPPTTSARQSSFPRKRRARASVKFGPLLTGLAIVAATKASSLARTLDRAGRRATTAFGTVARHPIVAPIARPSRVRYLRLRALAGELSELGRREELEGRRMVERLIRETTTTSVKDIAESAVKEVTHSPEVAALVRTQSVGLATGTILEVRENSEQADDRVERRVRSWLRLGNHNDAGERQPPPPSAA